MTVDMISEITRDALWVIIETSAPVLLISLVVGLIVSVFQTVTSIQEQTLTFVPKIISIFLAIMIFGGWMLGNMIEFTTNLWSSFSIYLG